MFESNWNRRRFLKVVGTAAATSGVSSKALGKQTAGVAIAVDPSDAVAAAKPAAWAAGQLAQALQARGIAVRRIATLQDAGAGNVCIVAAGAESAIARSILREAGTAAPAGPEALALTSLHSGGKHTLLACGSDARGLVYALTELAGIHTSWAGEYADDVEHLAAEVQALLSALGLVRRDSDGIWWFSPATGRWQAPGDKPDERPTRQKAETAPKATLAPEALWPDGSLGVDR